MFNLRAIYKGLSFSLLTCFVLIAGQALADTVVKSTGPATTKTEILAGKNVAPMLTAGSGLAMRQAEERYGQIAANGGWPKVTKSGLKKGDQNDAVAVLNKRLYIEGYLRIEATQNEFANVFTTATQDAVARFQRNNGLAITGQIDQTTLGALNVPARERLRTISENIPRLEIYGKDLGTRYLVVNVPAQQIETVDGGRVYSRHNAIVGRPERPTPVVMTALSQVKFNPYWNAPASIVERDIIPKLKSGTRVLDDMNIKVFEGVGGPEIDPSTVDWDTAIVDNYHFRQEPGPGNAMATAKIEFQSPFGIYLHDTPERQLFKSGRRFFSSGCVRVDRMDVMLNWVLNGQDGYGPSKISAMAETLEQVEVPLITPPQLRVVYLTAWPVGNTVAFRPDVYDLDGTEFTVGQPMPVGEESPEGLRYTLKPIPRLVAQVDAGAEGGGLFSGVFGKRSKSDTTGFRKASAGQADRATNQTGGLFANTFDNGKTPAETKPKATAKKSHAGFFDWLTYRKEQRAKETVSAASSKPAKPAAISKAKQASAGTTAKKAVATNTAVKPAPKDTKQVTPAATKTPTAVNTPKAVKAVKPDDKACKPATDGKLPKGCPVVTKAKPATAQSASSN